MGTVDPSSAEGSFFMVCIQPVQNISFATVPTFVAGFIPFYSNEHSALISPIVAVINLVFYILDRQSVQKHLETDILIG